MLVWLVTQEMGNSDEEVDDDLPPPVAPEQDLKALAVAADQQEMPRPPVMKEVPPPAAVTNAPAPHRSARPPECYGWNLRGEECSNWLTMEQRICHCGACAVEQQSPV